MGSIFISYSKKDVVYAAKLVNALKREGFNVWIDLDMQKGTQWDLRLEKQLKDCDLYLLIVSNNSYESKWVRKEVLFAQTMNKPIIPIMLEETEPWLVIMDKQGIKIERDALPPESFYERLAKITTRGERGTGNAEDFISIPASPMASIQSKISANTKKAGRFFSNFLALLQNSVKSGFKKTTSMINAIPKNSWVKNISSKIKKIFRADRKKR